MNDLFLVIALAIAVAAWAWGVVWARRVVRGLRTIAASARRIASGEVGLEMPHVQSPGELARASNALRDMKEALLERQAALALANHRLEDQAADRKSEIAAVHQRLKDTQEQLRSLAHEDPLTGLANRRAAEDRLAIEMSRHRRSRLCLSVMRLDMDGLDAVSDRGGPGVADALLKAIALALQDACRAADGVARIGGKEFLVTMPETTAAGARIVAEKVRAEIAGVDGVPARVIPSIGLVSHAEAYVDVDAVLRDAATALQAAKAAGRERMVAIEDLATSTGASSRSSRTSR